MTKEEKTKEEPRFLPIAKRGTPVGKLVRVLGDVTKIAGTLHGIVAGDPCLSAAGTRSGIVPPLHNALPRHQFS